MKTLLLTAVVFALLASGANAAEKAKKEPRKKKAESEEILRMDPYKVTDGFDLGYSIPQALHIVRPRVHSKYAGTTFELKFTVDRRGTPYNLGPTDMMVDSELVFQVISAVRAWHFSPARDSAGNAIERKVILPIIVVERKSN